MSWQYIDEYDHLADDVTILFCDTRDFHIICHSHDINDFLIEVRDSIQGKKEDYLYNRSEILGYLKSLEEYSGGKTNWRLLSFKGLPTYKGWLKYIRFVYDAEYDGFFCFTNMTNKVIPLKRGEYTPENIDYSKLNIED